MVNEGGVKSLSPSIKNKMLQSEMTRSLRPRSLIKASNKSNRQILPIYPDSTKLKKVYKKPSNRRVSNRRISKSSKDSAYINKKNIPTAIRQQVWLTYAGPVFQTKCLVPWCKNLMSVFDYHVGHNIPESKGGLTEISNLRPICSRCNLSMGKTYTITEWCTLSKPLQRSWTGFLFQCFTKKR